MAATNSENFSRRLANPELRCKNKCGFYGNPIYSGYCSKCYKELVRDAPAPSTASQAMLEESLEATSSAAGGLGFGKFNMKKKAFAVAKGRGKFFKSGTLSKPAPGMTAAPESSLQPQTQSQSISKKKDKKSTKFSEPFSEFLKTLKKPAASDIVAQLKMVREQVMTRSTSSVEEMSDTVQEFYTLMSERLVSHSLFRNMTDEQQEDMMDGIEKHLMTSIYNKTFSPASCDDEVKDILLLRKIHQLHWLEPSHLDVVLNLQNGAVQDIIWKGRQELLDMDSKKVPQDKLACISKCCQHLLNALRISRNGPASADEFLPSLIFMVIYTSPGHLLSNINYISRFSNQNRLMTGESGYYFTNICGVSYFIENVSAESLNMSEEEFKKKMGYVDGKTDADLLLEEDDGVADLERILVLKSCCDATEEVTKRMSALLIEVDDLKEKLAEFRVGIKEQVHSILSSPPGPPRGGRPSSHRRGGSGTPSRKDVPTGVLIAP